MLKDIKQEMIKRAGLTQETINKGAIDADFEDVLKAMTAIHQGKEVLYGNYIETHGADGRNFSLIQHFCDLKRKFVRAENFIKDMAEGKEHPIEEHLDTLSDLGVYCAMGIQLIQHLENTGGRNDTKFITNPKD